MNKYQMDYLLRSEMVGHLGCSADGKTYVVPVTYVYDGTNILVRTKEGQKVKMMRKNPSVCLEVDRIDNLANWQSVIVQGMYEELKGREAEEALLAIVNRLHPFTSSSTAVQLHSMDKSRSIPVDQLIVFRINISECTGVFEKI